MDRMAVVLWEEKWVEVGNGLAGDVVNALVFDGKHEAVRREATADGAVDSAAVGEVGGVATGGDSVRETDEGATVGFNVGDCFVDDFLFGHGVHTMGFCAIPPGNASEKFRIMKQSRTGIIRGCQL